MKMIINVVDLGTNYLVNNVYTDEKRRDDGFEKIEVNDAALFNKIKLHLLQDKTVRLPKKLLLTITDIILSTGTDVDIAKGAAISEVMGIFNNRVGTHMNFYFYDFQVLNNMLTVAGYNITTTNKEDQYLAILSTGDSILIDTLQKFLEVQASIEEIYSLRESTKDSLIALNDAIDITTIETIKNTFLSTFS